MKRAKYLGKCRDRWSPAVDLFYEYRGRVYIVTDEHNGYSESMATKHKNEQERIDREIEQASKPLEPWTYEGSAEEGFDLFWDYVTKED